MVTYNLVVEIDPIQIAPLQGNTLCIGRYMQPADGSPAVFNVIWSGNDLFPNNTFKWEEKYQVFGSNPWVSGAETSATTNTADIEFGQTCIIQGQVVQPATGTPDQSGKFHVVNQDDEGINVGVNCVFNGQNLAIYVTPGDVIKGANLTLEPITQVVVGFDESATTGTMIQSISGPSITVPYGGTTSQTVSYGGPNVPPGGGSWTIVT